jgi:hypothetical protein
VLSVKAEASEAVLVVPVEESSFSLYLVLEAHGH